MRSYYKYLQEDWVDFNIIYTFDPVYECGYEILKSEHPRVNFIKESNFKEDLLGCLTNKRYVLFLVDDSIFINNFNLIDLCRILDKNDDAIGVSLRLGKNTTYCYPYQKEQELPYFTETDGLLEYDWYCGDLDFSYPLELSSSLYRIKDILPILHLNFSNPNDCEWLMYMSLPAYFSIKPKLLCYTESRCFADPINKVQNTNNNKAGIDMTYSSENLLRLYLDGNRMILPDILPDACHMEVYFEAYKKHEF